MKTLLVLVATALVPFTATFAVEAAKTKPGHTLSEWKLGKHLSGPAVTLEQAKGKAVLIDYWGVNCPPCLAALPELEKLARRYKDKLVLIGAHSQTATDQEIAAVVKKNKLSYTITDGAPGPAEFDGLGLPHAAVFSPAGEMIYNGKPSEKDFEKAVRKAVQGSSPGGGAAKPSGLDALKRPGR